MRVEWTNVLAVPVHMRPTWSFVRALYYWLQGDEKRANARLIEAVAEVERMRRLVAERVSR